MRDAGPRYIKIAFEVRGQEFVPVLVGNGSGLERSGVHACAVEDMVYFAVLLDNGINEGIAGFRGTDVEGGGKVISPSTEGERFGEGGGVDICEGNGGAELGEFNGSCSSDS